MNKIILIDKKRELKVEIQKIPNNKYINYYYAYDMEHWNSTAGKFDTLVEAYKMAKKHRPTTKLLKKDSKMDYTKELQGIIEKLKRIDDKLFTENNFKNIKTNFKVYAQNKILSIVLDLECLQNGFKEEL